MPYQEGWAYPRLYIAVAAQPDEDKAHQVVGGAGMDQAEVLGLERVVLVEQYNMLVRPPDALLEIALRLFQGLRQLPLLAVVQAELVLFLFDVLPGKQFPSLVMKGGRAVRHAPDEGTFEGPARRAVLPG
jgi:hypothetical protein